MARVFSLFSTLFALPALSTWILLRIGAEAETKHPTSLLNFDASGRLSTNLQLATGVTWFHFGMMSSTQFAAFTLNSRDENISFSAHVPALGYVIRSSIHDEMHSVLVKPKHTNICFLSRNPICTILLRVERHHPSKEGSEYSELFLKGWRGDIIDPKLTTKDSLSRNAVSHYAIEIPIQSRPLLIQMWPDQTNLLADTDLTVFSECDLTNPIFPNRNNTNRVYNSPEGVLISAEECGDLFLIDVYTRRDAVLSNNFFQIFTVPNYTMSLRLVFIIAAFFIFIIMVACLVRTYYCMLEPLAILNMDNGIDNLLEELLPGMIRESRASGATKNQIESQILWNYEPSNNSHDSKCVICLENFKLHEMLRLLDCGHSFHVQCIDEWLALSVECPLCKQVVGRAGNLHTRPLLLTDTEVSPTVTRKRHSRLRPASD